MVGNKHPPANPSLIKRNQLKAKALKKKNNTGTMLCGRCSATCGNRCLKCPECPYVFKFSAAKGFTKSGAIKEPSPKVLRARIRIKKKYDILATAKEVYDDMKSYEPCLDLRQDILFPINPKEKTEKYKMQNGKKLRKS